MTKPLVQTDLTITYYAPDKLKPYKGNPRKHTEKQIKQIAKSMKNFGFTNPILVDDQANVIAGHGRLAAAKEMGMSEVPTIRLSKMTEAQRRAYILADNKIAENAGWDWELLKIEFNYLADIEHDLDITITGFEMAEIDSILTVLQKVISDPIVDIPKNPITKPGGIWLLGQHKIICGDALDANVLDQLMGDKKAQMVFTDPLYNVKVAGHICSTKHKEFMMASSEMSKQEFTQFLEKSLNNLVKYSADGSIHFICMDWRHLQELLQAGTQYDEFKNVCVWNKTNGGMGSLYRSKHELIMVYKNGTKPHINNVELGKHGRYRTNVWDYAGINTFFK